MGRCCHRPILAESNKKCYKLKGCLIDGGIKVKLLDQDFYMEKVKNIFDQDHKKSCPLAFVKTYGCQQNASDGDKIKGMLSHMGYDFTEDKEKADFILFNTCAIREHAEDRVFGNVGALKKLKKVKPSLIIALCGCMMEQEHVVNRIKNSYPFVDLVFGTQSLHHFPELIFRSLNKQKRIFEYGTGQNEIVEGIPIKRNDTIKASVSIMYGCDNYCSYCVVPYVRGRERSRRPEDILNEIRGLVKEGFKEITLLGQNVNSYGKNLEGSSVRFPQLLKQISEIKGDFFIRFMTSHPKDATPELIDVMASSEKICKHLHLPFQSGSDRILKEMNRKYTRQQYLEIISYAKKRIPGITFTSDVIVGFPGETYEDFKQTISLIKEVGFISLFNFIYSKRQGTRAASMDDPVSYQEKSKWFQELLDTQQEISRTIYSSMISTRVKAIVEKKESNGVLKARTSGNMVVEINGDESLIGEFVEIKIVEVKNSSLKGELI